MLLWAFAGFGLGALVAIAAFFGLRAGPFSLRPLQKAGRGLFREVEEGGEMDIE